MADALPFKTAMDFAYGVPRVLAPGVVRVVADNPGPFTFKGTNSYIVGTGEVAVIDPGPNDPKHFTALLNTVGSRRVTHIFVTHTHRDHTDGLKRLQDATGAPACGYGRKAAHPGARRTSPSGSEYVDSDFNPDIVLRDGDGVAGPGWRLTAVHTPGHAPDHLCFALDGTGLLFSGDHVMAWSTSIVAPPEGRMSDYMRSLKRMLARNDAVYLPGHGGRVDDPQRLVKAYLVHRQWREQAVLEAIKGGRTTVEAVVEHVYCGLDTRLLTAAALSVLAHVEHLSERGLVRCDQPPTLESRFYPV